MTRPTHLGRYEIVGEVGAGAMGVVYDGRDPTLGRRVAIKTIRLSHLDDPKLAEDYQARFQREAHAVALLQHPHIVTVYDYGKEDDIAYLVMEYIQGRELREFLERGERFPVDQSVRIMRELLEALDFAHKKGIVHRDIKPANIMLDSTGCVKLTDFGVARIQGGQEGTRGTMVGTLKYMSPEQILGQTVDGRADIFAAGVVLYQFLTGSKPFDGGTDYNIQNKIVKEEPAPPTTVRPELHTDWDRICQRALAKNREARYRTARDFITDLDRVFNGQPIVDMDATMIGTTWTAPDVPHNLPAALSGTMPGQPSRSSWNSPAGGTTIHGATADMELEFWRAIKDSTEAEDYELYLAKFPQGLYVDIAAKRSRKLRGLSTGTMPGIPGAPGQPEGATNATSRIDFNDPLAQTSAHPASKSYLAAAQTYSESEMVSPGGDAPAHTPGMPKMGGLIEPTVPKFGSSGPAPAAAAAVNDKALSSGMNKVASAEQVAKTANSDRNANGLLGQIKAEVAALEKKKDNTDPPALVKAAQAQAATQKAGESSTPGLAVTKNPRQQAKNGKPAKPAAGPSKPLVPMLAIGGVAVAVAVGLFMLSKSGKSNAVAPEQAASQVTSQVVVAASSSVAPVEPASVVATAPASAAASAARPGLEVTPASSVGTVLAPSSSVLAVTSASGVQAGPRTGVRRPAPVVPGAMNPDDIRRMEEARRLEEARKAEAYRKDAEARKAEDARRAAEAARREQEKRKEQERNKRPVDPSEKILN